MTNRTQTQTDIRTHTHTHLQFNFTWHGVESKCYDLPSSTTDTEGSRKWAKLDKLDGEPGIIFKWIIGADLSVRRPTKVGKIV